VDADQSLGCLAAHRVGDGGAHIPALGDIAAIAEAPHQLGPGAGGARHGPAGAGQGSGERVPRQRRDHQVEVLGQRPDQVEELGDAARVAVRDQQRGGVRPLRPDVQEVDALTVDLGRELRVRVEARLLGTPVEACAPVVGELAEVVGGNTAGPPRAGESGGPAGSGQPVAQVVQVGVGDRDAEGLDVHAGNARINSGKLRS
jgi:hypothetical protein